MVSENATEGRRYLTQLKCSFRNCFGKRGMCTWPSVKKIPSSRQCLPAKYTQVLNEPINDVFEHENIKK